MSGVDGKNGRVITKLAVKESVVPTIGFKKIRFLHETSDGDLNIDLSSLSAPADAVANGFSQPTVSDLTAHNLKQFKENFTLKTSAGEMLQDIDYVINGATTIRLLTPALDKQVFEGVIDAVARTGTSLVDAAPLVASGTLTAGSTDFNTGTPFQVGKFISHQHGSVMVMVEGQLMRRNIGNQVVGDGDYYEVHAGDGLGTLIRFNNADPSNDREISVLSVGSLVEKPDGSMLALIQTLQGQVDNHREILEDVTETVIAPGAPNDVDLKNFGDRVLANEDVIIALLTAKVPITSDSEQSYTPGTQGLGTIASDEIFWFRHGQHIYIRGEFDSGTVTAAEARINLPNSLIVHGNLVSRTSIGMFMSGWAGNTAPLHILAEAGNNYVTIGYDVNTVDWTLNQNGNAICTTGSRNGFWLKVPIEGWKATQTLKEQLGL